MKNLKNIITFFTVLFYFISFSQNTEITNLDLENRIALETQKFKDSIKKLDKFSGKLDFEYAVDTFKIDKRMELEIEKDYSTAGMLQATYNAQNSYDILLNKYYEKLLNNLKSADKETLKEAQRNWINYRNSESKLNNLISNEEYSGGGTIQQIFIASRSLEIITNRLNELYYYLTYRFMI